MMSLMGTDNRPEQEPPPRRPTIRDVAEAAGVSPTTVSHALNDRGRVDPQTRERVRLEAERIRYVPSFSARSLASRRSYALGLCLPQIASVSMRDVLDSDWYGRVIRAASERATAKRYALVVLPELSGDADWVRRPVDGMLVLDPIQSDPRLQLLEEAGLPHVSLGVDLSRPQVPAVSPDITAGTQELMTHLRVRGARRILLLRPSMEWSLYRFETETAEAWAADKGISIEERVVGDSAEDLEGLMGAVTAMTQVVLAEPSPPDAIIGLFDGFGASILLGAAKAGVSVPEELRIAQDIDGWSTRALSPAITALDQHPDLLAQEGIDLLVDVVEGREAMTSPFTPVTLRIRGSS
jgi:DNA-binding LacI/PurR family transcriptional regulator